MHPWALFPMYVHATFVFPKHCVIRKAVLKPRFSRAACEAPAGLAGGPAFLPNLEPQFLKASGVPSHLCASQYQVSAALSLPLTPSYMLM